jgi:truncated hemoglobin YjbI
MESNSTLFDRLGSVDAVKAAVEELYQRLLADEQTAPFFESVPMARLKVRCPYAVNIFFADYY